MTITYIHHSGYLLETEQALLLFDFVKGALEVSLVWIRYISDLKGSELLRDC